MRTITSTAVWVSLSFSLLSDGALAALPLRVPLLTLLLKLRLPCHGDIMTW